MKSANEILFRCSGLVHIMSEAGQITATQLGELRELQQRENEGKKPLTENMKSRLAELIAKRDNVELPDGVKTHLIDLYTSALENRREDVDSKQIEKGNVREQHALIITGQALKRRLKKNDQRVSNKWITGEIDSYFDYTIVDTKCAYTRIHFNRIRFKKQTDDTYENQGRGYMMLWGADKCIISHCCVNGLASHIQNEIQKLRFYYEPGSATWTEKAKQIEINHIFNLGEFIAENPTYELINNPSDWSFDIPWQQRVYMWSFDRDLKWEERLKKRVEQCRDWMNTNLFNQ